MVIGAKMGHSMAQNVNYILTAQLFPAEYTATAYGVCNFLAKMVSILSPLMAEMEEPIPMGVYGGASATAGLLAIMLITK